MDLMKKLLAILVLGLFLSGNAYAFFSSKNYFYCEWGYTRMKLNAEKQNVAFFAFDDKKLYLGYDMVTGKFNIEVNLLEIKKKTYKTDFFYLLNTQYVPSKVKAKLKLSDRSSAGLTIYESNYNDYLFKKMNE